MLTHGQRQALWAATDSTDSPANPRVVRVCGFRPWGLLIAAVVLSVCATSCTKDESGADDRPSPTPQTSPSGSSDSIAPDSEAGRSASTTKKPAAVSSALPELQDLTPFPSDVVEVIRETIRAAEANRTADNIGRLGCLYHVIARNRDDSERAKDCYELAKSMDPKSDKWPYFLGRLFFTRGSFERSRIEFQQAVELNPDYHRNHCWLGEIELKRKAGEQAKIHFQRYIELEPELADGYAGVAAADLLLDDVAAAYEQLTKALALEPDSGLVHQIFATYHEAKGDDELAAVEAGIADELPRIQGSFRRDLYEVELWRACGPSRFAMRHVSFVLSSGDGESARLLLEALLADHPDHAGLLVGAARVYLSMDRLDDAEKAASRALAIDPNQTSAHVVLSQLARRRGQYEEALAQADKALEIDSEFAIAHVVRGSALVSLKRHDEAVEAYREALRLEPDNPLHLKAVGESLQMIGQPAEAKKYYIRAIEIGESQRTFPLALMPVLANVARMDIANGDTEAAIRHFDRVVRLNPGREYAFQKLVELLISVGRTDKAIDYCRNLTEQFPQSVSYGVTLADLLARTGDIDQADEQLRKLAKRFPRNPSIPCMGGAIRIRNADYEAARAQFEKAIELQPQFDRAYLLLATMESEQGQPADAVTTMQKGLERSPHSAALANGLAWLLATCPDPKIRNPDEAVRLAESACASGGRRNANFVDTLACAYAAAGRFEDATLAEREAIDLAITQPYGVSAEDFRLRLEQFQKQQPYLETQKTD